MRDQQYRSLSMSTAKKTTSRRCAPNKKPKIRSGTIGKSSLYYLALTLLCATAHAEIQSQAFSGLNHFIPTHARLPIYKLKAQKSRIRFNAAEAAKHPPWQYPQQSTHLPFGYGGGAPGLDTAGTNCSLNIGNIMPGQGAAAFGTKETIVFIEGDVINAADCSR